MPEKHSILGGKVHVYRRENSGRWQCSTFLGGRNHRVSTGTDSLKHAIDFAEDWYLTLRGKQAAGQLVTGPTFRKAAAKFEAEFDAITEHSRNRKYVAGNSARLKNYLLPFFGDLPLSEVTSGKIREYRLMRGAMVNGKTPARSTLHQEIVTLRQVLKVAVEAGWLASLPLIPSTYKKGEKVAHRPWFSKEEYVVLYTATRERTKRHKGKRYQHNAEQLHAYVLIMGNTGLRPDEVKRLEYRDVKVVQEPGSKENILLIQVRGKRGVGYCKSMPGAVHPFQQMLKRNAPKPTDLLFPIDQREIFNAVLRETGLKKDREGKSRTAYSLRHTYISLRLQAGADIYQVAKNCRTSVEMIEKHYARHIENSIDAAAINMPARSLSKSQARELEDLNFHLEEVAGS